MTAVISQSAGAVEYIDGNSVDMILNNLMMKFL